MFTATRTKQSFADKCVPKPELGQEEKLAKPKAQATSPGKLPVPPMRLMPLHLLRLCLLPIAADGAQWVLRRWFDLAWRAGGAIFPARLSQGSSVAERGTHKP